MSRRGVAAARRLGAPRGGSGSAPFGMPQVLRSKKLYALSLSTANYYQTATGGGEAGDASGFGSVILYIPQALSGTYRGLAGRGDGSTQGWFNQLDTSNRSGMSVRGASAWSEPVTRSLVASDLGRVHCMVGVYTPATVRVACDTMTNVVSLAVAGFTAAGPNPVNMMHRLGRIAAAGNGANGVDILAHLTFRGTPTDVQLQALLDAARSLGDLPRSIDGATVTHRWSVREQLSNVSVAPRKVTGVRGFNAAGATVLASAAGQGLPGAATGWTHYFALKFDKIPTTNEIIAGCQNTPQSQGWYLQASGASLRVAIAPTPTPSASYTITAADVGRWLLIEATYTGSAVRMRVNGAAVGNDVAATFVPVAPAQAFVVGSAPTVQPAPSVSIAAIMGGNIVGGASAAQSQALQDAFELTGKLAPFAGMQRFWDLGADIEANGGAIPATFSDRIGTDTLTRVGTLEVTSATETAPPAPATLTDTVTGAPIDALARVGSPIVRVTDPAIDGRTTKGVLGFSASACLESATAIPGSEAGFRITVHVRVDAMPTGTQTLAHRTIGPGGWYLTSFAAQLWLTLSNGVTLSAGPVYTITSGDVGRTLAITAQYNGSVLSMVVDGVLLTPVAKAASPAIVPCPQSMQVGQNRGIQAATAYSVLGIEHGAVATVAEIQAQHAAIASTGRIQSMAAGSINRWDFTQDIDGATELPATFLDRIGTDHLTRVGSNLQIAQRVERVWSYETKPIAQSATDFSDAAYFGLATTPVGSASGFLAGAVFRLLSTTVSGNILSLAAETGVSDAQLRLNAGGIYFGARGTSTSATSPTHTFSAADVGKLFAVLGVHDGSRVRLYVKRVQQGIGTTISGFTEGPNAPSAIGRHAAAAGLAATGVQLLGVVMGNGVPTLEMYQAWYDACVAGDGQVAKMPGLPLLRYALPIDGSLPAQLAPLDGVGPVYTRQGSLTIAPLYARAWAA